MQVFCIFLFMCAATLFGALVSELNEIVATSTYATKELDEKLESYSYVKPKYARRCDTEDDAYPDSDLV